MSKKILIVEDEPIIAEDLSIIVQKEGYQVIGIANDGSTAMDMLYSQQPDIVLLDIALSTAISGFDVAEVINTKYQIPFIFITSFSDKHTLEKAKDVYPHGYIVKPFKKRDILANIEIALHRNQLKPTSIYRSLEELNTLANQNISMKEYEILLDLTKGKSNQELCDLHFISMNTVKTHLKRIFSKLDIKTRVQAIAIMIRSEG
ncbi:MAG: response regulator transcription factor [Saprospiraceae bacterium]|nr:response regulator transcription factor [Saprospiraceae bacterium]